jgi:FKBP-type peptidyl-prolyl cis-trans isomerase FkpA
MKNTEMKKYLLLILCVGAMVAVFSSCRKTVEAPFDPTAQAKIDDQAIQDYFLLNEITDVTKDPSGLYYHIDTPGTGPHPTASSNVVVNFKSYLLDDTPIETQSSYYLSLPLIDIKAFSIGLPLIGKGGTITLYIPSALGFGTTGSSDGSIPANTCTIYHMTLQGFVN